ncbi:MAG TPA: FapA family protein, partial [Planctomycetota bacterium]|nr:FapA family protein [Planctomycetota bacterium]
SGTHGVDVRGTCLAPKPGRPLDPARVMGEGTRLSVIHADLIESASAGHFFRDRQRRLCVQPRLIVEGDVDFHHGNIDTKLSVLVKGDVKAGFTIKSAGDIEVMGVIEDARVSAQGGLVVRGGILPGVTRVKAHGDIDARYVSNREVKCHTLRVAASLRWSRVMATGEVIAKEILAGDLISAGSVTVEQLGSVDGVATRLQVGTNPFEERQFIVAKEEHERLTGEVKHGKERCKLIAHRLTSDPSLGDELRTALEAFSTACTKLATCEALLERHVQRQEERARQLVTATVSVSGTAHRGVELHFDEVAKLALDQDLVRPQFRMAEGAIVW